MQKLVSVIMPCYNQAQYVRESIESVLNQTYQNIELLLIDNASTDGTKEVIKEFEKKDKRIVAIYHKKNLRFETSFTEGMGLAKGEYLAFTSSDDVWLQQKLDVQIAVLETHPEYDIVHSDALIIDENGNEKGTIREFYRLDPKEATGDVFHSLTKKNICCTSTVLIRRKCLQTADEWDPSLSFAHDWWLYLTYSRKHRFFYLTKTLAKYRVHSTNTTKKINWVYTDYAIIHKRLADQGIDPKEHLMKAALSYARIGNVSKAIEMIKAAETHGKLTFKERCIKFFISTFGNTGWLIGALNIGRHTLLWIDYKFKTKKFRTKNGADT